MAFIDELNLELKAGTGGDGVVRWRREKFKPKCGPGGGNGGPGGDVFVEGVSDLSYLQQYQYTKSLAAKNGSAGDNYGKQGASGEDLVIKVPVGTVISQSESGFVWDIQTLGQKERILRGGRGGLGNEYFKSSKNVTPEESTPGAPGESGSFHFELQMVADIGLIGLPSAGKSSLLNAITSARSKVGAYDFTTLEPHLGVLVGGVIIADIPGLIEGASSGKGLGIKFLKHIRRTRVLVHLVSAINPDPYGSYVAIRKELGLFDKKLLEKQEFILLSQSDEISDPSVLQKELSGKIGNPVVLMSIYDENLVKNFIEMCNTVVRAQTAPGV
jgi:GTP-binding protein